MESLVGKKFERWTVLEKAESLRNGTTVRAMWFCKCDCGTVRAVAASDLKSSRSKSCGCYQKDALRKARTKHGMLSHPAYRAWSNAWQRCTNESNPEYQ